MQNESTIADAVQETLAEDGEVRGTETFMLRVNAKYKLFFVKIVRRLAAAGHIDIVQSDGGRGNKTVYKRNRNSAGQPSRGR